MRSIMALALLGLVGAAAARAEGPAGVPAEFIKNVNRAIGDWQVEVKVGDMTSKARWSAQWVPGQYAYLLRWEGPGATGPTRATGLGTWDPREKVIREILHDSAGDEFVFIYNAQTPKSAAGEGKGVSRGKPYRARIASEYLGPDEFVWKATDIFIGEEKQPDRVLHFRRAPAPPKPSAEEAARLAKLTSWFEGEWAVTKAGDAATKGTLSIKPTPGGRYLLLVYQFGEYSSHILFGYDPLTRRWSGTGIGSDGTHGKSVWDPLTMDRLKPGDTWKASDLNTAPDGTRVTATYTFTIVDDKTFTISITDGRRGTEKLPDAEFRYTRKE